MKHATTEQLLDIKDGIRLPISEHVAHCEACQMELSNLKGLQNKMNHSAFTAPAHMWEKIAPKINSKLSSSESSKLRRAIYTMAASILITGGLVLYMITNHTKNQTKQYQSMIEMMVKSTELESAISTLLRDQPVITTVNNFDEKISWRLMLIDQEIQLADQSNIERRAKLWQDRVNALQDLSARMTTNNNAEHVGEI